MSTHTERTLSIIKPDAVKRDYIGNILSRFENAGMKIIAMKMMTLSKSQAETFYNIHKERPFFGELVDFISSDSVVVLVLEGKNAVQANRDIMGATNPDATLDRLCPEVGRSSTLRRNLLLFMVTRLYC